MPHVALIGGSGFIGTNLTTSLNRAGFDVTVFSTTQPSIAVDFQKFDVTKDSLQELKKFDAIVNLAARVNVQQSIENPLKAYRVNFLGALNVMNFALLSDVFFIQLGTALAYRPSPQPLNEDATLEPKSPYAAAKVSADLTAIALNRSKKMRCAVLRLFNVYGPFQKTGYGNVVSTFIDRSENDQPIVIYGTGTQERDFIYVSDVCSALLAAVKLQDKANGKIFNIGSGTSTSILKLAELVGGEVKFEKHEHPQSELSRLVSDNSLAKEYLKWNPGVSLKRGIELTRSWVRENRVG